MENSYNKLIEAYMNTPRLAQLFVSLFSIVLLGLPTDGSASGGHGHGHGWGHHKHRHHHHDDDHYYYGPRYYPYPPVVHHYEYPPAPRRYPARYDGDYGVRSGRCDNLRRLRCWAVLRVAP